MKRLFTLSLLAVFICCDPKKKSDDDSEQVFTYETQIDVIAGTFLKDSVINSLSIGVYYKGEEFIKHYGELDPNKKNSPVDQTIYDIGSVSKTFVGTLVSQAEIEGRLSLEDDIRDFLNDDYSNLQYKNKPIRIKHLITHSSGLPPFLPQRILDEFNKNNTDFELSRRVSNIEKNYTKKQFLEDLKTIEIDTFPGYKYSYSNVGAEIASYILEKVYQVPFERLLEEEIWRKANMTSTMIDIKEANKKYYANGYGNFGELKPHMQTKLWGGSGFCKSTSADLMSYIKYQLDENNLVVQNSHKVLYSRDTIDGDSRIKIGHLWQISTDKDFGQVIKHHGGAHGAQNWILIYPEEKLGLSVITNQSGRSTAGKLLTLSYSILDEIAKHKRSEQI